MVKKTEILKLNNNELSLYSSLAKNQYSDKMTKKGFRDKKVPDMFLISKFGEQITDLTLRYSLFSKYGANIRNVNIKMLKHNTENGIHIFELELIAHNQEILDTLQPTEEYNKYINDILSKEKEEVNSSQSATVSEVIDN